MVASSRSEGPCVHLSRVKLILGSSAVGGNMFLESNASWIPGTHVGSWIRETYLGSSIPGT